MLSTGLLFSYHESFGRFISKNCKAASVGLKKPPVGLKKPPVGFTADRSQYLVRRTEVRHADV